MDPSRRRWLINGLLPGTGAVAKPITRKRIISPGDRVFIAVSIETIAIAPVLRDWLVYHGCHSGILKLQDKPEAEIAKAISDKVSSLRPSVSVISWNPNNAVAAALDASIRRMSGGPYWLRIPGNDWFSPPGASVIHYPSNLLPTPLGFAVWSSSILMHLTGGKNVIKSEDRPDHWKNVLHQVR